MDTSQEYRYGSGEPGHTHRYLWPKLVRLIEDRSRELPAPVRVMDVGAGNGAFAAHLAKRGFDVVGVDPSSSGVEQARRAHPDLAFHEGSAYDDLAATFGTFPIVTCLEVVEHCFYPRRVMRCLFDLLEPGGSLFLSTPYHGYLKNVALALTGRMDAHFTALWDNGHIKFFSGRTITTLCREVGFRDVVVRTVGRVPPLAKSMLVTATKPGY